MDYIFVTGTAGFVGSVVTESLIRAGFKVIGIDNFQTSKREAVNKDIIFFEGDYGDQKLLKRIFSKYHIELVFHFAAETTVDFAVTDPDKYFHNNIVNGLSLLNVMKSYECMNIIFSSSAAIFGYPKYIPIDEKHPKVPISSYGDSKLMFEKILTHYHRAYGIRFNCFRYFNAAGATKANGENRLDETHLLPLIFKNLTGKLPVLKVFGNDYETRDGTCIRDYVHVQDIAEAHLLAIENIYKNPEGKYNLGSGSGYSVLEIIDAVENQTQRKVEWEFAERRSGDPPVLVASNTLAIRELGWKPVRSNLNEIIKSSYEWLLNLNAFNPKPKIRNS